MKTSITSSPSGIKAIAASLLLSALLFTSTLTYATDIANSPLFLSNSVQPNIFFSLDDSGSMAWEYLPNKGAPGQDWVQLNFNPESGSERQELCPGYNALAYNPNVLYTPWRGWDARGVAAGNEYKDADIMEPGSFTQIRNNAHCNSGNTTGVCSDPEPWNNWNGTTDLTEVSRTNSSGTAFDTYAYYPWTDTNGNGSFDADECGETISTNGITWDELPSNGTTNVPAAQQQRNYANWYSYYRKRDFIMKRAVSELIYSSRHRMGMATLHNRNDVGTPIANVDDISTPQDATAKAAKENLLTSVSSVYPRRGTPLRLLLENTGQYFEGSYIDIDPGGAAGVQTTLFGSKTISHPNSYDNDSTPSPIFNAANGGECQQNFTILLTDGYYNGGDPGNGDIDGDDNTIFDGGAYADTWSDTLADVAMKYYERDLASSLANLVPTTTGVDEASHQHMVTFTVAFGVSGTLDPNTQNPTDTGFTWPDPEVSTNNPERIDDLWHAAYNGRGQFMNASDGQSLIKAFEDALTNINQRIGSASAVAVSSGSVSTDTRLFQSTFDSGNWEGHLYALQFVSSGGVIDSADWGSTPSDAGEVLKGQDWDTGREIITWNPDATTPDGAAFRWGSIGATNQTALIDAATAAIGQERLEFVRGDHSNELKGGSGSYRSRGAAGLEYKLGDIVHSSPLYVGAPPFTYADSLEGVSYNDFRVDHFERKVMIYVGANDGMLHAFDAATGEERLAYVPAGVYNNLPALTDTAYTHQYYVDETPSAADVFYSGAWHTVLLGSLRAGGRSVFALDITDPLPYTDSKGVGHSSAANFNEANAANIALWEYTDADLGYTFGKPGIGRMANGKWVAIFSNGYNNSTPPPSGGACGTTYSCTGFAYLYIVDIETGALITKIDTEVGSVANPNGLTEPTLVDDDGDNIIDLVYAGDLYGNMWKFDVSDANPNSWGIAKTSGGNPVPLFTATDDANNPQPITAAPEITDAVPGVGGLMVYFGTGRYMGMSDVMSTQMQSFYGIWDKIGTGTEDNSSVAKNKLLEQAINQFEADGTTPANAPNQAAAELRVTTNTQITNWGTTGPGAYMGWKVDFDSTTTGFPGESVIYKALAWNDNIVFGTLVPESKPCGSGLSGWIMALNRDNGGTPDEEFFAEDCDGIFCSGKRSTEGGGRTPLIIDGDISKLPCDPSDPGCVPPCDPTTDPSCTPPPPPVRNCNNIDATMINNDTSGGKPTTTQTKRSENLCRQTWREL